MREGSDESSGHVVDTESDWGWQRKHELNRGRTGERIRMARGELDPAGVIRQLQDGIPFSPAEDGSAAGVEHRHDGFGQRDEHVGVLFTDVIASFSLP